MFTSLTVLRRGINPNNSHVKILASTFAFQFDLRQEMEHWTSFWILVFYIFTKELGESILTYLIL